ncbi:2-oxoglutarate dehydrogenase E1 component [hydrothermal vent metagenome]|uniref:oxoglutarate dehydrogenase (succinyl-transferring) n=1 Tax=hydrothermal vent metagenome TaxID=652676 RepID=A0A3B0R865_9ZZZZ
MSDQSFLSGTNAAWLEQMQNRFAENPESVPDDWRAFFEQDAVPSPSWKRADWPPTPTTEHTGALTGEWATEPQLQNRSPGASADEIRKATQDSLRALMLIRSYRVRGHLAADLDPLGLSEKTLHPELDPTSYGFGKNDMDRQIFLDGVLGLKTANINQIMRLLQRTYCGKFAIQFMHIADPEQKSWLQQRIESDKERPDFTPEGRKAIWKKLMEVEAFEQFLHKRYPGTKRFGLDGGESLIPAMEQIIKRGGTLGVEQIVLGMPHRGRLNVLTAVMGKAYSQVFNEFAGGHTWGEDDYASGDVKYHLGASSDREFDGNSVHLSLTANPSHLEAVNPVVLGKARAKQEPSAPENEYTDRSHILPLLLHGDAAFAGQGIVAECFAMSGLVGHQTGGTIHFIVNNQIGFTTSPQFSRSSPYPTDIALAVQPPIFHVNGDDPEAVVHAAKIAIEFRQKFDNDVIIDMFCYRRYGHNEGDDPSFTQPIMYRKIKGQKTTLQLYSERLLAENIISQVEMDQFRNKFTAFLETEFEAGKQQEHNQADWLDGAWSGLARADEDRRGRTGVSMERLKRLGVAMTELPQNYDVHRTLKRVIGTRRKNIETGKNLDWATAEHLAFATLLDEKYDVRLSGQDCGRGTFSQRHSRAVDQQTEKRHTFLNHVSEDQATYEVIDSLLSEEAVLGFEYGYSLAAPNTLTLWEAQFGDFANGAHMIVDQFLSSGERKWLRMSGLVMLLPHGYEGQGPEHSSARLERYLQACAQDNLQVANCSTPANYFHILRRQIHRNFRKPLILMTPKSLLRHKRCVSDLSEMNARSSFHRVLWDDAQIPSKRAKVHLRSDRDIRRVVICSGKVYYDLFEARETRGIDDVYLMRLEQFYPVPTKSLRTELSRFKNAEMVWCQEEPKNMGAWSFIEPSLEWVLKMIGAKQARPHYVGRKASASTATGAMKFHLAERDAFLDLAFAKETKK